MEDPFGLLEISKKSPSQETKQKKDNRKVYLTVMSVLVVFSLLAVSLAIFSDRGKISADSQNPAATIKITNLPSDIKTGQTISFNLVFTNTSDNFDTSYALIQAKGLSLNQTTEQAKNLLVTQDGYLRKMIDSEYTRFDQQGDSGIYYRTGALKNNESKSLVIKAVVNSGAEGDTGVEAKMFTTKYKAEKCGFLRLSTCQSESGTNQIASATFQLEPLESGKIKLRSGFNFVSLPYIFSSNSLQEFFASLKSKWAYIYAPSTGEYLNLLTGTNTANVKPGSAFWVYDANGGEYDLPTTKVETNINETYSIPLSIGWNQVGNPYSKRMILSSKKIIVKELSDSGSELGTGYDLKTAIANGVLSDPYMIVYPTANDSSTNLKTVKGFLDNMIEPFSGFLISSTKKVNLIIPGKEVIAPGDVLSGKERTKIENWISENGFNQYGDPNGTVYAGGTPLYDENTGQTLDRMDYILERHPDRPWNR